MFGNTLQDFQVKPLRRILEFELGALPTLAQENLWKALEVTFSLWKDECATKEMYSANTLFALLGGSKSQVSDEAFSKAEPWQCAGFGITCRTELAYQLWFDDYPRFKKVIDTMGVPCVFALLASKEDSIHAPAIIRVAGMLADLRYGMFGQYYEQANRKEQKKLLALALGRKKGANVLRAKAEQARQGMRDFARSYFMRFPAHTYDDAVGELLSKPYSDKPDGKKYSARRLKDIIGGVKDEALQSLETSPRT